MNKYVLQLILTVVLSAVCLASRAQDHIYTLEECIQIAYEKNLTIQRSKVDLQISEVNKNQKQFERLPNVNLGANYGMNWGRSIDPTTNTFITQRNSFSRLNGGSTLTVFNGMQISNSIKQAHINHEAASTDVEKAKNDVGLNLATLYLNVLFNKELVENARYQLNSTNRQLDQTKTLVEAGALPMTNLLDLQAQVASNEVSVINAENNHTLSTLRLKQSLMIPSNAPFEIEIPSLEVQPGETELMTPEQIYQIAEATMPEVKSAHLRVEEADLQQKIAKGAYAPTLSLSAGFSTNYSSFTDQPRNIYDGTTTSTRQIGYVSATRAPVFADITQPNIVDTEPGFPIGEQFKENINKSIGIDLSIPVFNRFRTKASVQRSQLSKYRAEIASLEVKNQLRQTIETAYSDMKAASKAYRASQKQVEALDETFRVIENQFNIGAANSVDYQLANNKLYMAKSDLLRAKYDFIFKQKIVDFYLGKPISF